MTRSMRTACLGLLAFISATSLSAQAEEGMFTPDQLPEIAGSLEAAGLEIEPEALSDLTGFPMGAIVSLGGCSASFVSTWGLAVTNHHCVRGSIQFISSPEQNYLETGFLATRFVDEAPAAPGTRIFVTVDVEDVTDRVRSGLDDMARGRDVFSAIEARRKEIVAECEAQAGHRCQVASFYGGAEFKLIDRLEIKDVRLVYAPGDAIGRYGGDIDNWMWPRHTGDFAIYRAYVAPDGSPAEYDEANVPFQPSHVLEVSAEGVSEGDFVMVAGYPGTTSRYARLTDLRNTFSWQYPARVSLLDAWIGAIDAAAPPGSDVRIKYEARLAGLSNYQKYLEGQIAGAERAGLVERRRVREEALADWAERQPSAETYLQAIKQLDRVTEQMAAASRRSFWYSQVRRPQLLSAAQRLYRLAQEREKPDEARAPGFQERDMAMFRSSLEALDRRFDPAVDLAEWQVFLDGYLSQPAAARIAAYDSALGLGDEVSRSALSQRLEDFYAETTLSDAERRLELMEASAEALEASDDPFMQIAVALYETDRALEEADKELSGRMARLRPLYMDAIRAWQADLGSIAYPDANSTLRVTYGSVMGPPEGGPAFTTLEGIAAKHTGEAPFDAPAAQLEAIAARNYGPYAMDALESVPVNFLSDLDVTGGNSGSATLDSQGRLVGLLFDGTLESVNSDWDFDAETTRAIHVDTRYMLWVMETLEGARWLLNEMTIVGRPAMETDTDTASLAIPVVMDTAPSP